MKKMKTLFKRQFVNHKIAKCLNEIEPECQWVLNGEGWATEKIDGTCCLIKDGKIYRRYDYKVGRTLPQGAIPCQEAPDPITEHFPHWLLCTEDDHNAKYYLEAYERQKNDNLENGTYELIGKHVNSNPYNLDTDILEKHGKRILKDVPRDYKGIKQYLENHYIEGIVFYRGNGEMCKIKRSDFGFEWNRKKKTRTNVKTKFSYSKNSNNCLLRNQPEGISMAIPMKNGGMSRWKVITCVILSGIATGIGALIGAIVGNISSQVIAICLAFAAGAMLYIVSGELIPESNSLYNGRMTAIGNMLGFIIGLLAMVIS